MMSNRLQPPDPEREKNLFLETDLALHEHCQSCVILSIPDHCNRYGCKVIACPHDCGQRFHSCKTEEHLLLCQLVKAPCINATYGCPIWMQRRDLGRHLSVCPASVVYCNMERNRKPLTKEFGKKLKRRDGRVEEEKFEANARLEIDLSEAPVGDNHTTIDSDQSDHIALDLALAYSDQRQINAMYRIPRAQRKAATNFFNKRHPALPLLPKTRSDAEQAIVIDHQSDRYREDEGDSSDDEAAARRRNSSIMSPVARECILCKIDPSSQHLHQLRGAEQSSMIDDFEDGIELDENANESSSNKKKPWVVSTQKGASFYADRSLMIDLSPDFLPTHYPKCGSYYTIVCDQLVRRDEYGRHFANVHNDIVDGLDGWAMIRCPLWRYGCGCYATRLEPADGNRKVIYNRWRDAFSVKFTNQSNNDEGDQQSESIDRPNQKPLHLDFMALPYDIIAYISTMLDPSSLYCLSATCQSLNHFVHDSLLTTRGIVDRQWLKVEDGAIDSKTTRGRQRWTQGPRRWMMSKSFERIHEWRMKPTGRFVDHIQKCPFYEPLVHTEERIPVLTFAKPFVHRPNRRDMYRAGVVMAVGDDDEDEEGNRVGEEEEEEEQLVAL